MKIKSVIIIVVLAIIAICAAIFVPSLLNKDKYYMVKFDTDGGTEIKSVKVKENEIIKLQTNVVKEGYVFAGWLEDGNLVSNEYKVTKNTTLKASWELGEISIFTVSFDTDGGTKIDDMLVKENELLVLPNNPTKEGYVFAGWKDTNDNNIYDKSKISSNITLVAIWEKEGNEKPIEKEYYCEVGYTLNGNKCSRIETINHDIVSGYTCPSGTSKNPKNEKQCIQKIQTGVKSLCDNGALNTYIKNNKRYCVYQELYIEIKDASGEDLPVSERLDFCKTELGEKASVKGTDNTNKFFICEISDTTSAKKPEEACAKGETYKMLSDGMTFACYNEIVSEAKYSTVYCPSGYVKGTCTDKTCVCSKTITVAAKEK